MHVIDVGIDSEPLPGVVNMRVARGCGNIARGPAMSREQGQELLLEVMRYTRALAQEGLLCLVSASWGMAIYHAGGGDRQRSDRQRCAGGGRDWRQSAVGEGWQQGGGGAAGYRRQSARPE